MILLVLVVVVAIAVAVVSIQKPGQFSNDEARKSMKGGRKSLRRQTSAGRNTRNKSIRRPLKSASRSFDLEIMSLSSGASNARRDQV